MTERERVSWRWLPPALLRESRAAHGRLLFFTACLAVGVAAVVGVATLVGAIRSGMQRESRALLAADLALSSRRPLPDDLEARLAGFEHASARVTELAAMASAPGGASRLVELKAVDPAYPFYGELRIEPSGLTSADLGEHGLFVAPELALALDLQVGAELFLGGQRFVVQGLVQDEPDRLDFALTLGPRVFLSPQGLERTRLVTPFSRVQFKRLVRLADPAQLPALERRLREAFPRGHAVRVRTHHDAQPNVRRSLGEVEQSLGLVALLSLLLGGIGVAQIVRTWIAGKVQSVAVLRTLGLRAREIAALYLGQVGLLALAGSLAGALLGAALPLAVARAAPELFGAGGIALWQPLAFARGVALGLLVALLFSLLPLTALWRVPPAAVLRASALPLAAPRALRLGAALALLLGLLLAARLQGGSWLHASAFTAGTALLTALLYGGARLAMQLAGRLPRGRLPPTLEHGLVALARPGAGTAGGIVALGLGVMVVLTMLLVERRLGHALRDALGESAPSIFLVDVQPEQWERVRASMGRAGAQRFESVPVVMARLSAISGKSVSELVSEQGEERRGAWVLTREQRLTWLQTLPADNRIVAGALWNDPTRPEVSLEEEFAKDLGVGLGDTLAFDVQGVPLELRVTSLRKVDWQSFAINFFLVVEPGVLEEAPHSRIAAARLDPPEAELRLQNELARDFPNLTLLRVRPILEKIAGLLERVAAGVRALGSFSILTGLAILAGAIASSALRRNREAALLKTLGVTRAGVARLFAVEHALTGLVAGTLGAAGALLLAGAFLDQVLRLEPELSLAALPIAALGSAALSTLAGLAASLRALRVRPLETLRS